MAALLVACVHCTLMLGGPAFGGRLPLFGLFRFGHAGVDFFFVLSGFIIYYIHQGEIGQQRFLPAYLYKRFARIYPTYWIVLLFFSLVIFVQPDKGSAGRRSEKHGLQLPSAAQPARASPGPGLDAAPRIAVLRAVRPAVLQQASGPRCPGRLGRLHRLEHRLDLGFRRRTVRRYRRRSGISHIQHRILLWHGGGSTGA